MPPIGAIVSVTQRYSRRSSVYGINTKKRLIPRNTIGHFFQNEKIMSD